MNLKTLFALAVSVAAFNAQAALITHEFNNGDDLSGWSTDRCAPQSFSIVDNELVMAIDGASQNSCGTGFYETQGMKLDIGMSTILSIDMYVDSANWLTDERFAGIWGVAYDSADVISYYPILEYFVSNGSGSIHAWDDINGWADVGAGLITPDAFNNFAFNISGGMIHYMINGQNAFTASFGGHSYFGEVILNAKNDGNSFNVRYDNLAYGVPEPASLAILSAGLLLVGATTKRRKTN